jgi:hypothetical protein
MSSAQPGNSKFRDASRGAPVHRVEGPSPCLLPGGHPGAALRCAPTLVRPGDTACASAFTAANAVRSDRAPPGHRGHGPSRDGRHRRSHHRRAHRPVSASVEPQGTVAIGAGSFSIARAAGLQRPIRIEGKHSNKFICHFSSGVNSSPLRATKMYENSDRVSQNHKKHSGPPSPRGRG